MSRAISIGLASTLFCTSLAAQTMSGLYTLNPSGSGSRNFKTFVEATYNLSRYGVSAPVTIEVADGTYSETDSWTTTAVPGASSSSRVTFRGKTRHGAKIPLRMLPKMGGYFATVRWIVVDGFRFLPPPKGYASLPGFAVVANTRDIEIKNCHFDGSFLRLIDGVSVDVHHCLFDSRMDIRNVDILSIHHNEFRLGRLSGNSIKMEHVPSRQTRTRIYNNLIWGAPFNSGAILDFRSVQQTEIDHNTFAIFSTNNWTGVVLRIGGRPGLWNDIRNNLFYSESTDGLLRIESQLSYIHFFNRNVYWIPSGSYLAGYPRANQPMITYANLAAWQRGTGQDPVGIQADPRLINIKTGPYNLRPRAGSVARGAALKTVAWVTDDFDGDTRLKPTTIGAYETAAELTPFGSGCAGTGNQVPRLGYTGSLKPRSSFTLTLTNASPRATSSFLAVGASNASWGSVPLPFALGGGCSLLVAPHLVLAMPVSGGKSSLGFTLPVVRGAKVYFQWGVVDPAAGGIGLAMTNGATLTL